MSVKAQEIARGKTRGLWTTGIESHTEMK